MDYNDETLLIENYNKFIEQGMTKDDAFTEAYSIDCNLDLND